MNTSVESIGPMLGGEYRFSVGGFAVPNIVGRLRGENDWTLILDRRFSIECTNDELNNWLWFLVNAMAVAAGYTHFGEDCKVANPFGTQVGFIGDAPVNWDGLLDKD